MDEVKATERQLPSPRPWRVGDDGEAVCITATDDDQVCGFVFSSFDVLTDEANAELIVKAVNNFREWQPIESVPRDGTHVLFYTPYDDDTGWLAFYAVSRFHGEELDDSHVPQWQDGLEPTHWQPLPPPPETAEGKNR